MGMDTPETVQTPCSGPEPAKVRNMYTFIIPYNNTGYITAPGYYQAYLSIELPGNGCCFPYYLPGGDFMA
jgi:hypothetical protein